MTVPGPRDDAPTDWETFHQQQAAAAAAVQDALGDEPVEFTTAGELAALMARLPPHTPVSIVETVHIDPRLNLDDTSNRTTAAARSLSLVDPDPVDVVDDGEISRANRVIPGVELGAVIVGQDTTGVPSITVPFPAYERAVEALGDGDLSEVLRCQAELLTWMASTLARTDDDPDDADDEMIPEWTLDEGLRAQVAVEGERLRQAAARLDTLRARVAEQDAAVDVTDEAEAIVERAVRSPADDLAAAREDYLADGHTDDGDGDGDLR